MSLSTRRIMIIMPPSQGSENPRCRAVLCCILVAIRINELHPDYLNARIESCEDEGVSRLSTNVNKANTPSSVSSLVHSTTKITVSEA